LKNLIPLPLLPGGEGESAEELNFRFTRSPSPPGRGVWGEEKP